jgi:hypothetical protein
MIKTTATEILPGDVLHRVAPISPRSAVWDRPVDLTVLEVGPHPDSPDHLRLAMSGPYRTVITLDADRTVWLTRYDADLQASEDAATAADWAAWNAQDA